MTADRAARQSPYVEALQKTLAAEHAAVFVYADLGARTSQSAAPDLYARVTSAYTTHRARRDRLTSLIDGLGADPVAAEAAYRLPDPLDSTDDVEAAAVVVERRAASSYAFWVANAPSAARREAVRALTDAAVRAVGFGGAPQQLPGL